MDKDGKPWYLDIRETNVRGLALVLKYKTHAEPDKLDGACAEAQYCYHRENSDEPKRITVEFEAHWFRKEH